jgi:hypothetical protein
MIQQSHTGHIPRGNEISMSKRNLYSPSTIHNSQEMETIKSLSTDRMDKENVVQYWATEKDKILSFLTTWMELEITVLSEISQAYALTHN